MCLLHLLVHSYPHYYLLVTVSSKLGHHFQIHQIGENFLAVSPARFIQCTGSSSKCKYNNGYNHHRIAVEVKCLFPNQDIPEEPYYKIPARHVPQVLAEMAVSEVEELWLICLTRKKCHTSRVAFDGQLWKHIFDIAVDLYDPENPKVPTRLHALLALVKKKNQTIH